MKPRLSGRRIALGVGPAIAAMLVAGLVLTACGDNAGQAAAPGDPQHLGPGAGPSGSSTATGDSDTVGGLTAVAGPTGPLDTTTWVLPPPFSAAGDEPFWRMEIVDGWFSFKRSGLRAIEEPLVQPHNENGADVFDTGSLKVMIRREACETEQGGKGEFSAKVTFEVARASKTALAAIEKAGGSVKLLVVDAPAEA
mgnify:CR=1 FL=1